MKRQDKKKGVVSLRAAVDVAVDAVVDAEAVEAAVPENWHSDLYCFWSVVSSDFRWVAARLAVECARCRPAQCPL